MLKSTHFLHAQNNSQKLYYFDPRNKDEDRELLFKTIEENLEGFTNVEIDRARTGKKAYHKLGAPGMENFKYLLKGNMINNCPVTHHDVDNMIKIWGKDIAVLKGKSVRKTPRRVETETHDIPEELKNKCEEHWTKYPKHVVTRRFTS